MKRTAGLVAAVALGFSCIFAAAQSGYPDKPRHARGEADENPDRDSMQD